MRLEAFPAMPSPALASDLLRTSEALTSTTRHPSSLRAGFGRGRGRLLLRSFTGARRLRGCDRPKTALARPGRRAVRPSPCSKATCPPATRQRGALTWR
jgi:hypothetical protein